LTTTPFFKPLEGWIPQPDNLHIAFLVDFTDYTSHLGGTDIQPHDEIAVRFLAIDRLPVVHLFVL
jgi:hypothetical protein